VPNRWSRFSDAEIDLLHRVLHDASWHPATVSEEIQGHALDTLRCEVQTEAYQREALDKAI